MGLHSYGRVKQRSAEKAKNNPAFVNGLAVTSKGRLLPNPGGIPIIKDNEIVGSVGISGDKGENDEKICIESVKKNGFQTK